MNNEVQMILGKVSRASDKLLASGLTKINQSIETKKCEKWLISEIQEKFSVKLFKFQLI